MSDRYGQDGPSPSEERQETPAETLDRNWNELLQELRVTQTGTQILVGFLLTVPFQPGFGALDPTLRGALLVAVGLGTLATLLLVAPVAAHRLLFRRHAKDVLVSSADAMAKAGLVCLALTIALVVAVVFGFVLGPVAALIAGGVGLLGFTLLWVVVPASLHRSTSSSRRYR